MSKINKRKWLWIALVVGGVLLMGRLYLPHGVESYVNRTLRQLDGYDGAVGDIDMQLWRGAYRIESLVLDKRSGGSSHPFVSIDVVDISLQWGSLLRGELVGELHLQGPTVRFVDSPDEAEDELGEEGNWVETVRELVPTRINAFTISGGKVSLESGEENPFPPAVISDIACDVSNLSNVSNGDNELPTSVTVSGWVNGSAPFTLQGGLDLLATPMEMDFALSGDPIDLVSMNELLQRYAGLDVGSGTLGIYSEWAVRAGQVDGYLKLVAKDLEVFELKRDLGNPIEAVWEGFAGFAAWVMQNRKRDQFAAKIPFEGSVGDLSAETLPAVASVFRNAFVEAMKRDFEGSVDLSTAASE